MSQNFSVYGIGNPLMDFITYKDHEFLKEMDVQPGTMNLLSYERMKELLDKITEFEQVPGGSSANTLRGVAWLSRHDKVALPVYNGAVGKDERGEAFRDLMEKTFNIKALIHGKTNETGVSIVIVTPDYERTMFTYLGACREFDDSDINFDVLGESDILHLNGYMWDTDNQKNAVTKAIDFAKKKGIKVSFDLADPFVVNRNRDDFLSWLSKKVDILFGNLEECALLTGVNKDNVDQIVMESGQNAAMVIVKAGSEGCYVNNNGAVLYSRGKKIKAVDTIGAGDSFAAGFLYGLLKEKKLSECAELANSLAAGIVSVEGCNYNKLTHSDIFG